MKEVPQTKYGRLMLASSIIFMAASNGEISREQWGQLHSVVGADDSLLSDAMDKVRETPIEKFLTELSENLSSDDQKLCILLNVLDSMLADEQVAPEENTLFNKFKDSLDIPSQELDLYFNAIKIKNNIPTLDAI